MQFIDVTPPRRSRYDFPEIKRELKKRPGVWAEIDEGPSNVMAGYASKWRGLTGRFFEWQARSVAYGSGRSKLYGRYIDPDA